MLNKVPMITEYIQYYENLLIYNTKLIFQKEVMNFVHTILLVNSLSIVNDNFSYPYLSADILSHTQSNNYNFYRFPQLESQNI